MNVINNYRPKSATLQLPANLCEWLSEKELLHLALDASHSVGWEAPPRTQPFPAGIRPQMLLTLLTYCYSTGIYATEDILNAVKHNRAARYICAHHYPDYAALRKFRRAYRSQIEQALRWVLLQAWARRFDAAEADYLGYEWFVQNLNQELDAAVQARMELAIVLDGVEND